MKAKAEQVAVSKSPAETESVGESWGREAQTGWVIALIGDLGAGKTQLTKGIARGLGFSGKVQSPTFALINEYLTGRLPIFHIDLYRLDTRQQIIAAGLEEYLSQPDGVTIVEWAERWFGSPETARPALATQVQKPKVRLVTIESTSETERRIRYEDFGA